MPLFSDTLQRVFGTYPLRGEALSAAVASALNVGYRAFDSAQMYANEADLGLALAQAIAEGSVTRRELCIISKVHPDHYSAARFLPSVEQSLRDLRCERLDLLLLHWPPQGASLSDLLPSLRLLESALHGGLARHIGISNYTAAMMRYAKDNIASPLRVNQVEFHPLLNQGALLQAAAETNIQLMSYCAVARGAVMQEPVLLDIGQNHHKTAAQVALRWILQKGVIPNAMSSKEANIRANFALADFVLSAAEMQRIDALGARGLRIVTQAKAPWAPVWDPPA